MFKPTNILVTGGAGFIGSHFILYLLNHYDDIKIVNMDNLSYAADLSRLDSIKHFSNYKFIQADICDAILIADILHQYQIDTIVNFAAQTHVDNSIKDPEIFIKTNIQGTHNLLYQALIYWKDKHQLFFSKSRFHQISTDEVYGSLTATMEPFTEDSPLCPSSPYSASKAAADHLVHAYFKTYGLPVTLSRCSNNYGANQHKEKLIPKIIDCGINQVPIPLYHDGSNVRDWIEVNDHCKAINIILRGGSVGSCYNVGASSEYSNLAITNLICHHLDHLLPHQAPHNRLITFVTDRLGHDFRYAINSGKIQSELGWKASANFEKNIYELVKISLQREQYA